MHYIKKKEETLLETIFKSVYKVSYTNRALSRILKGFYTTKYISCTDIKMKLNNTRRSNL